MVVVPLNPFDFLPTAVVFGPSISSVAALLVVGLVKGTQRVSAFPQVRVLIGRRADLLAGVVFGFGFVQEATSYWRSLHRESTVGTGIRGGD